MRLAFGCDHAGFKLCEHLLGWAQANGYQTTRFGATSEEPFDYPEASDPVAHEVLEGRADFGVLICGSGIGVCIRANRYPGIRAGACTTELMAQLTRQHNHANVLCLGERLTEASLAEKILATFLATPPETAERHRQRVDKLDRPL